MKAGATPARRAILAVTALLFCAAPTPGDVGGCGQAVQELDPDTFHQTKASIDCERCLDCELTTAACDRACGSIAARGEFPAGCVPLVHDGEACLRALLHASCGDYAEFMSDRAPSIPTECNFCPLP